MAITRNIQAQLDQEEYLKFLVFKEEHHWSWSELILIGLRMILPPEKTKDQETSKIDLNLKEGE